MGESNPRIRNANAAHYHCANGPYGGVILADWKLYGWGMGEDSGASSEGSWMGGVILGEGSGWGDSRSDLAGAAAGAGAAASPSFFLISSNSAWTLV